MGGKAGISRRRYQSTILPDGIEVSIVIEALQNLRG
jgi:hypothetical protein